MSSTSAHRIDILMATYNGSRYIESQLFSLLGQTVPDWNLLIHDDGSTDDTLALISKYAINDSRIIVIQDDKKGLGPAANFLHILQFSSSPYIVYCDQDDIWLEDKLAQLLTRHQKFSSDHPLAVYCNGYAYSAEQGVLSNKITRVFPKNLRDQLFLNAGIQGCSLMMNRALKDKLSITPDLVAMHDHFITLGALSFGRLEYVDRSLMLYRQQHDNKATANIRTGLSSRISSVFNSTIPVIDRMHYEATKSFYQAYEHQFSCEQKELFNAYFKYGQTKSLLKRLILIIRHRFNIYNSTFLLLIKTITRKGIN